MEPMLATAVTTLPSGDAWAYEFKWDGVRALADVSGGRVRITSRAGNDVTGGYPELAAQLADLDDALLDGEIVAFVDGRPSFERLQTRMHVRGRADVARAAAAAPVTFVVFDLLRRDGTDLTGDTYTERRAELEALSDGRPWSVSPAFDDAEATESVARAQGLEGVVAKRTTSTYRSGARTEDWRKLRFLHAGEFVVLGWDAAPEHPRTPSALVLGIATDDGWRYAGRVGSGLSGRVVGRLRTAFVERATPPVAGLPGPTRGRVAHWVEPTVVVDVGFTMWTGDGVLRQPVFRGIRTDKRPEEAHGDA